MIRVLHVYDNDAVSSGITSTIMNWYDYIDIKKVQFDFLFCWKKTPSVYEKIKNKGANITYIVDKDSISNPFLFIQNTKKYFEKEAYKYDVIHLHSAIFSYPILFYSKKFGIKHRIIHVHSLSTGNTPLKSYRNNFLVFPMKWLATDFLACSQEAANNWFEKRKINDYKIIINGLDLSQYTPNKQLKNNVRKALHLKTNEIAMCHISNMSKLKNVPFVIKVFNEIQKHKECKLFLIGRNNLPESINKLIYKYNIEDKIVNLGVIENIPLLLQGMDVCLMPSISEGYGLVPIECQAAKVPVIISSGFPSIIDASPYAIKLDLNLNKWIEYILYLDFEKIDTNTGSLSIKFDIKNIVENLTYDYEKLLDKEESKCS